MPIRMSRVDGQAHDMDNETLLKELRAKVSEMCPALFDVRDMERLLVDDAEATAILKKGKLDIEVAYQLAGFILEWRKKNAISDMTAADISQNFYEKNCMFVHGRCKQGYRILYFIGRKFLKEEEAEAKALFTFLVEQIRRDGSRITFILDASDCGMNNVDIGLIKIIVDCFMTYFPGVLGRTFVVDLPVILTAIWNIVKIWFDEELKAKTHICGRADLLQFVEAGRLNSAAGGDNDWKANYEDAVLQSFIEENSSTTGTC